MAAALQAQRLFLTASTSSSCAAARRPRRTTTCRAALQTSSPRSPSAADLSLKLDWIDARVATPAPAPAQIGVAAEKLRAVAEAAADRAEMHDIIGRQRDNWNHLLLHSTNSLTLAASAMAALAPGAPAMGALKASAGILLATAAVTMAAVNKIQPSQLAEEQRNATRLWRQLERDLRAALDAHHHRTAAAATAITEADVQDAMDRVLALDAAYPLPLLGGMLDKFPKTLEPTRWWPKRQIKQSKPAAAAAAHPRAINGGARRGSRSSSSAAAGRNGWTQDLEDEMRGLVRVLRAKDEQEYVKAGTLLLTVNRGLAVAGPALAGTAAVAAAFAGAGEAGTWASGAAALCGALAAAANTVEHGGQLGMLFELCRNVAGFYRKVQEDIEACLDEADADRRENGEVFEAKVALLLGRRASELRQFRRMASASVRDEDIQDYAGKLF